MNLIGLLLTALAPVALVAETEAPVQPTAPLEPCVIVLHGEDGPSLAPSCRSRRWRKVLSFHQLIADRNRDGWSEVVMGLTLDPSLEGGRLRVELDLGDEQEGWLFNLGDSRSNNGHGGGPPKRREHCAEVQLLGGKGRLEMQAFSDDLPDVWEAVEFLMSHELAELPRPWLAFEAANQELVVEFPTSAESDAVHRLRLATPLSGLLFELGKRGRRARPGVTPADRQVHVAVNRVIAHSDREASRARYGRGVRRISLQLTR
ncbi:MAG: hypothetical protein AAF533_26645 [Acidobacteriota bacterium]